MNREIKFKYIWQHDTSKKFTSKIYDLSQIKNGEVQYPDYTIRWDLIAELQYTGLKDKNGKEIYEGDVLIYIGTNMSSMSVKFKDGCFVGEGPFNTLPLIDYAIAIDFQSLEIIGNIYENPELLK